MAETVSNPTVDPNNGYCSSTKTFHSLRPRVPIPTHPLSVADYAFHLLHSSPTTSPPDPTPFLIDSSSGHVITFSSFIQRSRSLAASLLNSFPSLTKNDVALIISPPNLQIPVVYFALLSIGVTVCPVNPLVTMSELTHMIQLTSPVITFTISPLASKVTKLKLGPVLVDSSEFDNMMSSSNKPGRVVKVDQSDRATILFSSGTTGRVKGVDLTHRNFISLLAGFYHVHPKSDEDQSRVIALFPLPLFHVFGFFMLLRSVSAGETIVLMTTRVEFEGMLKAVERYKVTHLPVSPPLVLALGKSPVVEKYDLTSLGVLGCGGAPLGKEVVEAFKARFPGVTIGQVLQIST